MSLLPFYSTQDFTSPHFQQFLKSKSGPFTLETLEKRQYDVTWVNSDIHVVRSPIQKGLFTASVDWFSRRLNGCSQWTRAEEIRIQLLSILNDSTPSDGVTTTNSSHENMPVTVDSESTSFKNRILAIRELATVSLGRNPITTHRNALDNKFHEIDTAHETALKNLKMEMEKKAEPFLEKLKKIESALNNDSDQINDDDDLNEIEAQLTLLNQQFNEAKDGLTNTIIEYEKACLHFTHVEIQQAFIDRSRALIERFNRELLQDQTLALPHFHRQCEEAIAILKGREGTLLKLINDLFSDPISDPFSSIHSEKLKEHKYVQRLEDSHKFDTLLALLANCKTSLIDINEEINRIEQKIKLELALEKQKNMGKSIEYLIHRINESTPAPTDKQKLLLETLIGLKVQCNNLSHIFSNKTLEQIKQKATETAHSILAINTLKRAEKLSIMITCFMQLCKENELKLGFIPPRFNALEKLKVACGNPFLTDANVNQLEKEAKYHRSIIETGLMVTSYLDNVVKGTRGLNLLNKTTTQYSSEIFARINSLLCFEKICYNHNTDVGLNNLLGLSVNSDGKYDLSSVTAIIQNHINHITEWGNKHYSFFGQERDVHRNIYEQLPAIKAGREIQLGEEHNILTEIASVRSELNNIDPHLNLPGPVFAYLDSNSDTTQNLRVNLDLIISASTQSRHHDQVQELVNCSKADYLKLQASNVFSGIKEKHQETIESLKNQISEKLTKKESELEQIRIKNALEASPEKLKKIKKAIDELKLQLTNIATINTLHKSNLDNFANAILVTNNNPDLVQALLSRLIMYAEKLNEFATSIPTISNAENAARKSLANTHRELIKKITLWEYKEILTPPDEARAHDYADHTQELLRLLADFSATIEEIEEEKNKLMRIRSSMQREITMTETINRFLKTPRHELATERINLLENLGTQFNQSTFDLKDDDLFLTAQAHLNAIQVSEEIVGFLDVVKDVFGNEQPTRVTFLSNIINQFYDPTLTGTELNILIDIANNHKRAIEEGIIIASQLDKFKDKTGFNEESQARINSLQLLKDICFDPTIAGTLNTFQLMAACRDERGIYNPDLISSIAHEHCDRIMESNTSNFTTSNSKTTSSTKMINCTITYEALRQLEFKRKIVEIENELRETKKIAHQAVLKMHERGAALERLVEKTEKLLEKSEKFKQSAENLHDSYLTIPEKLYRRLLKIYEKLKAVKPL